MNEREPQDARDPDGPDGELLKRGLAQDLVA